MRTLRHECTEYDRWFWMIELEEFEKLWKKGNSGKDIAKYFGIPKNKVYDIRKKLNLPKRSKKIKINLVEFESLWNQSFSIDEISEHFKIRISKVYILAKELNLPKRTWMKGKKRHGSKKLSMFQRMMMRELEKR